MNSRGAKNTEFLISLNFLSPTKFKVETKMGRKKMQMEEKFRVLTLPEKGDSVISVAPEPDFLFDTISGFNDVAHLFN